MLLLYSMTLQNLYVLCIYMYTCTTHQSMVLFIYLLYSQIREPYYSIALQIHLSNQYYRSSLHTTLWRRGLHGNGAPREKTLATWDPGNWPQKTTTHYSNIIIRYSSIVIRYRRVLYMYMCLYTCFYCTVQNHPCPLRVLQLEPLRHYGDVVE